MLKMDSTNLIVYHNDKQFWPNPNFINAAPYEVRKTWALALLSGKYRQIQGALANYDSDPSYQRGYCCLGVYCKIFSDLDDHYLSVFGAIPDTSFLARPG